MRKPTVVRASLRLFAALLLFCYSLVSIILPFQHHDCLLEEMEGVPCVRPKVKLNPGTMCNLASPLHTQLAAAPAVHPLKHCLACEWQNAQLSAALPILRLKFVLPPAPRIPTTLPRYLSVRVISTSSRAPPTF